MAIEEIEVGQEPEINLFEGPIAGQSMAASPENKMPWDGPPKFSSVREASEAIFLDILEDDNLKAIVTMLQDDVPVSEITQVLLMTGFSKGQYNPDLLMLLIEPVMYMIMAIADKFGIADVKIYTGEEEDYDEDFDEDYTAEDDKKETATHLQELFENKRLTPDLKRTIESSEVAKKLANIDVESLMAKPEGTEPEPGSLMSKPTAEEEENARR